MLPPGAPISGLNERSGARPYELKLEMRPPVGLGKLPIAALHVSVVGPRAIWALTAAPRVSDVMTTGIVTAGVPAMLGVMNPGALLYRTTPMAPALWALNAFV